MCASYNIEAPVSLKVNEKLVNFAPYGIISKILMLAISNNISNFFFTLLSPQLIFSQTLMHIFFIVSIVMICRRCMPHQKVISPFFLVSMVSLWPSVWLFLLKKYFPFHMAIGTKNQGKINI